MAYGTQFHHRLTALLTVAVLLLSPAAHAGPLQGPIRVRDLSPFSLQRLDFQPASALAEVPGHWAFEANLSQTNTFVMSPNVSEYLANRGGGRRPVTAADAAALDALGEDYYYFDGSITVAHLTTHYALSDSAAIYATLPLQWHGGGFLDQGIESFHDAFGLGNAGRQYVAQDQYAVLMRFNGEDLRFAAAPGSGLGDPVLGFRYRGLRLGEWRVVLEAAVTLPLGTVDEFFANDAADQGAQVSLQRQAGPHGIYFSFSHVRVGTPDHFTDSVRRSVPSATAAYEYALGRDSSVIAQFTAARSTFADGPDRGLTDNEYQASLGWRRTWDHFYLTLALTENVFTFNNTPDIGFHVGLGWAY